MGDTPTVWFSRDSASYARFRPSYPDALFDHLASLVRRGALAWDCATGNGQAAVALARRVGLVVATDGSVEQLSEARPHQRVVYAASRAESTPLADRTADLVTVAQALHWLPLDAFWSEVRRILRPGGIIAVWSYALITIDDAVDAVIRNFHETTLGPFWPPGRALVDDSYRSLVFPFEALAAPAFAIERELTLPDLIGYIGTWSALERYRRATGRDPLPPLEAELSRLWGGEGERRPARWPLALRIGRVPS